MQPWQHELASRTTMPEHFYLPFQPTIMNLFHNPLSQSQITLDRYPTPSHRDPQDQTSKIAQLQYRPNGNADMSHACPLIYPHLPAQK